MTAIEQARDTTLDITERTRTEAERIGQAIQTNSSGEVARIAHELVGCSACGGVEAFSRPLGELERFAHEDDLSWAHVLLADVRQKYRASRVPSRNLYKHCQPPIHNR
jgi:HPt (histidine-containing phosphotransfer) domain-containing protein